MVSLRILYCTYKRNIIYLSNFMVLAVIKMKIIHYLLKSLRSILVLLIFSFYQFFGTLGYNNIVGVDKLTKKIRTVTDNKKDILQRTRDLVHYSKSLAYMQLYSQIGLCYNFTTKSLACLFIRLKSNFDIE